MDENEYFHFFLFYHLPMNYYHILDISHNASQQEIKKKYRALAIQHHPDKNNGNDLYFKQINEAYQILSNSRKRANYDFLIRQPIPTSSVQKKYTQPTTTNKNQREPIRAKRYDEFTQKEKDDLEKRQVRYYKKNDQRFVKYVTVSMICFVVFVSTICYIHYLMNPNKY